ncbi:PIG-L family deacetylase [soil metagenome]
MYVRDGAPLFSPSDQGTPERDWQVSLVDVPVVRLPRGQVVVVAPHPDDETLGAGGVIATTLSAGFDVTVVSCSDGEGAYDDPGLGARRRDELDLALRRLAGSSVDPGTGGTLSCVRLELPDGQLSRHEATLVSHLEMLTSCAAAVIGPWPGDGHPDHEAVGRACEQVTRHRPQDLFTYPIWAWHWGTPDQLPMDPMVRVTLDCSARLAKTKALGAFTSQTLRPVDGAILPSHVLAHFHRPYEVFFRSER